MLRILEKYWKAILLIVFLIPYPTTTVPEWRIRYIDTKGRPFVSLPVEQTWQNYSVESSGHTLSKETDRNGYVIFPEHDVWASLLHRIVGPIGNVLSTGIEASFGPSSWLINQCNLGQTEDGDAYYNGDDLPSTIVLIFEDSHIISPSPQCATIEAQAKDAGPK